MNDISHFVERPHNLRKKHTLERKRVYTVYHGSLSLSFLVPKLWDLLQNSIKNSASLNKFELNLILGHLTTVLAECVRNMLGR